MRIIGIGNHHRRDDGVGLAVARNLAAHFSAGEVHECHADLLQLIDLWANQEYVVLIDACSSDADPGTVSTIESFQYLPQRTLTSSHGFDLVQAWALGAALQKLPQRLRLIVIEVSDVSVGIGLSPPVESAMQQVTEQLLAQRFLRSERPLTETPADG